MIDKVLIHDLCSDMWSFDCSHGDPYIALATRAGDTVDHLLRCTIRMVFQNYFIAHIWINRFKSQWQGKQHTPLSNYVLKWLVPFQLLSLSPLQPEDQSKGAWNKANVSSQIPEKPCLDTPFLCLFLAQSSFLSLLHLFPGFLYFGLGHTG